MPFLPIHTEGAEDCFQVASGTSRCIQQLAGTLRVFRKCSPPFSPFMYLFLLIRFASSPSVFSSFTSFYLFSFPFHVSLSIIDSSLVWRGSSGLLSRPVPSSTEATIPMWPWSTGYMVSWD